MGSLPTTTRQEADLSNNLNSLLQRVAKSDSALARELGAEIETLSKRREFGLNFEKHRPETVELHGRPVRVSDKVRFLPPRGTTAGVRRDTWTVRSFATADPPFPPFQTSMPWRGSQQLRFLSG